MNALDLRSTRRARSRIAALVATGEGGQQSLSARWLSHPTALGAVVAAGVAGTVLGPPGVAVLGVVWLVAHKTWHIHLGATTERRRAAQLPEALERMAAGLRTGSTLTQALSDTGSTTEPPLGLELVGLAQEASHGRRLLTVLDDWAASRDDAGTRLAGTALSLATIVGTTPARAIDGVAATLRERLELAGERRALATQARTSALVLSTMPLGFGLLLALTDATAWRFLVSTPLGWACLAAGIGLDAVGAVWMARLTRVDGR